MLRYRPHLVPLSPAFLVAAANACAAAIEPGALGFVHHVGYSALYDQVTGLSNWPLPATGSCDALARAARAHGVLRDEPYVGDIFLLYSQLRRRFIHTGIVVGVLDEERVQERDVHVCVTVEGNTNEDGSVHGHATLRMVRTFREADGHKFIRWAEIERRAAA